MAGRTLGHGKGVAIAASAMLLLSMTAARADCPGDDAVAALATSILQGEPAEPLELESIADGLCARDKLLDLLIPHWGAPIGYKAALTGAAAQARFGVEQPIPGVLLADMMLEEDATVPADFGALPRYEADLIVVVANERINEATTPEGILGRLSAVHPFIELPDLVMASPADLSGPVLASINAGARHGVLGEAIPVEQSRAFFDALEEMTVTVTNQDSEQLASASGSTVLGHPLNAVLWLVENGVTLAPGDLVSVGSIGPLLEPEPGLTATATYAGLPGDPELSVTFE